MLTQRSQPHLAHARARKGERELLIPFHPTGSPVLIAPGNRLVGFGPNGIKLASELLLDHLLTQFLPGFDHQREALGSPFLDARLHSMRSDGVDDQRA